MCGYLDAEFTYFLLFLHKIGTQIHKAIYCCWQKKTIWMGSCWC